MFIFRSRRTALVRKIWAECLHHDSSSAPDGGDQQLALTADVRAQLSAVLKRLREPVLEQLVEVLERRGQYLGPCCSIPNTRLGRHNVAPLVLMCKLWRWKDLTDCSELVRLPVCKHDAYGQYECCNPYHWARQANPEDCLCSSPARSTVLSPLYCDIHTDHVPYNSCDFSETVCAPPPGAWLPAYHPPGSTQPGDFHCPDDGFARPSDAGHCFSYGDDYNHQVPYNNQSITCDKSDVSPPTSAQGGVGWETSTPPCSPSATTHKGGGRGGVGGIRVAGLTPCHIVQNHEIVRESLGVGVNRSDANDNHAPGTHHDMNNQHPCQEAYIPGSVHQPLAGNMPGGNGGQSVATGGTNDPDSSGSVNWCTLAYWEERTRVGRQFPVSASSVQVFSKLGARLEPDSQALCLHSISARDNAKAPQSIVKARDKIGLGVVLSFCGSTVSVYNRSDIPLFVNSPTLDLPNSRTFSVYKILPGYSMKVFDFVTSKNLQKLNAADPSSGGLLNGGNRGLQTADGPFDPHAVRLSFGKGWGGKYSRQIVTSCPCWLEILLVPPR